MDEHYRIETTIRSIRSCDMHEFTTSDDERKANAIEYQLVPCDLFEFSVTSGVGQIEQESYQRKNKRLDLNLRTMPRY